jgi:hypothetical protein
MPNVGQYHEVMDRAALMVSTWEREIEKLDATQAHPELKDAAEKVGAALADFYGLAGQVYFKLEEALREAQRHKP